MSKRRRKPQKNGNYTLNKYPKGMGNLCCTICGLPYRDHRIGPCPFAVEGELQHKPTKEKQRMDR